MTAILAFFTFLFGALAIWSFRLQWKQRSELEVARREEALAKQGRDIAETAHHELEILVDETQQKNEELVARCIRLETENEVLRDAVEAEKRTLAEAKESLADSFRSLAASALEGNNRQFLELAKSVLERENGIAKTDLEKRHLAIEGLLVPMKETLEKYQTRVAEIEIERQKAYTAVESELRRVVETGAHLTQQTAALKDALKRPHVRGRWGEVQLRNCIELAGMSEFADVTFQDTNIDDEGVRLVPDMTVRMPGQRIVIVDAKTPTEAFLRSLEAPTDEERTSEMARHGRHVREHVKKLSGKAYNENLKDSADFTVMFLPNESFLYAALETQPDLVEFALQKKVLIATPPTLIGLLKVIRFGWNEEKLARNAQAISEAGSDLHRRLVEFVEDFESIGQHLQKAAKEYESGFRKLNTRVLTEARKLESLGVKSAKEFSQELGHLEVVSSSSSEIN